MELPLAVQQQAQQAQQIENQLSGEQTAPAQVDQAAQVGSGGEPKNGTQVAGENLSRDRQRYETLKGMYRADQNNWRAQMSEKEKEIEELKAKLSQYTAKPVEAHATADEDSLIGARDKEVFGEDMYDFVQRSVRETLKGVAKPSDSVSQEVANLKKQIEDERQAEFDWKKTQFFEGLSEAFPAWKEQNSDQGFIAWLQEPDQFSGIPRQEILNRATRLLDVTTTAGIFQAYANEVAASQKAKSDALEKQVAPARNRQVPVGSAGDVSKRVWLESEIDEFYKAKRRHEYTPEEAERIEKEIDQAAAEGRVK